VKRIKQFMCDQDGDMARAVLRMAEKGVVLAVIILAALAMWQLLGNRIAGWVNAVACLGSCPD
jgi:hypothetical protein